MRRHSADPGCQGGALDRGIDPAAPRRDDAHQHQPTAHTMNKPTPSSSTPFTPTPVSDAQIRSWLQLRRELAELHARLEYVKLMVSVGVKNVS